MKSKPRNNIKKPELQKAIDMIGGVVLMSEKLNIVPSNISNWLHSDVKIPIKHAISIEQLTKGKVSAKNLRPDIFKYNSE